MKMTINILLLLLLGLILTSCTTIKTDYVLSMDESQIQAIDIYNIDDVSKSYSERNIHCLRSECTPTYTLTSEQYTSFLDKLTSMEFEEEIVLIPIPMDGGCDYMGYIVSIVYIDGSYDIIAEEGQFSYSSVNGYKYSHADYSGTVSWSDFIREYIEMTLQQPT
ncbi:MAG: hypothetical protein J6K03_08540 [Oscillospiraceae bacterium]|nr:hypothetical protein [Oscillospiraceae bacterium]